MDGHNEEWSVVGHPRYAVSRCGSIRRVAPGCGTSAGRALTGWVKANGYRAVYMDGGHHYVHTVVLEAFVGPRPPGCVARHLDGNPLNNHADNLAWGAWSENSRDMVDHGRSTRGGKNRHAKLSSLMVRALRALSQQGASTRSLAELFRISPTHAYCVATGRSWGWLS